MGGNTRGTQLDELLERLDRLEAENEEFRERLDDTRRAGMSRRALLGGGAALGTALVATGTDRAVARPVPIPKYMELDKDYNEGTRPTILKGTIEPHRGDDLNVLTAAFRVVNQNRTGTAISVRGESFGIFSSAGGVGVLSRSDGGGVGVEGWTDGFPDDPVRETTSGVWGHTAFNAAPAFLAGGKITLRTLENDGGMPESDDAKPGDLSIRTDPSGTSTWWVCVKEADGGTPAEFLRVVAPGAAGAFEALPAPIRVYDSRPGTLPATGPKTPIDGATERVVSCEENTGGQVPGDARAVLVNLTIANPTGAGWAALFADGATWAGTSNVNFTAGQVIANSATVGCGPDAGIRVRIGEAGLSADVIVDVMGFYR